MRFPECYPYWLTFEASPGVFDSEIPGGAGCKLLEDASSRVEELREIAPRWRCRFQVVRADGTLALEIPAA